MSDLFDAGFVWDEPIRDADRVDLAESPKAERTAPETLKSAILAPISLGTDTAPKHADPVTVATVATVADWKIGLATLHAMPCPDWCFPERWKQLNADADWFAMSWAEDAFAAGWTVLDAFGCFPQPWYDRVDHDGLVKLLRGRSVVELNGAKAVIKNPRSAPNTFYRTPGAATGVPLWIGYAEVRPA